MSEDKNNKTTCPENVQNMPYTYEHIAYVANCSLDMVKAVKSGKNNGKGKKGKAIKIGEQLLTEGLKCAVEEIKKLVPVAVRMQEKLEGANSTDEQGK